MFGYISQQTETHRLPYEEENCGACGGTGYQKRTIDGINVVCPVCLGTGKRWSGRKPKWQHDLH